MMNSKNSNFSKFEWTSNNIETFKENINFVKRLEISKKLQSHRGCVNTICWSEQNPSTILSGSDDKNLKITNAFTGNINASIKTAHQTNIFSAKFLSNSNDEILVSSSSGGDILINYAYTAKSSLFKCHGEKSCYEIRVFENSSFLTCGKDGCVKFIDLRQNDHCDSASCNQHNLIQEMSAITSIAVNPLIPYHFVTGSNDGVVRYYDFRMLNVGSNDLTPKTKNDKGLYAVLDPWSFSQRNSSDLFSTNSKRITSVQYDNIGSQVLASAQPNLIYLMNPKDLIFENQSSTNFNEIIANKNEIEEKSIKYRIQSDWTDTGPNSISFNEMRTNDPRIVLSKQIEKWVSNVSKKDKSETSDLDSNLNTKIDKNSENNFSKNNSNESNALPEEEISSKNKILCLKKIWSLQKANSENTSYLNNGLIKDLPSPKIDMIFTGHRNTRTLIKECNFWENNYVMSGSDCGNVFFWDKLTGKIVNLLLADKHVVNCVQKNPYFPILSSSGIDYDIKIWEPTMSLEEDELHHDKINQIVERNKHILEESKNTVSVPMKFMMPIFRQIAINSRRN